MQISERGVIVLEKLQRTLQLCGTVFVSHWAITKSLDQWNSSQPSWQPEILIVLGYSELPVSIVYWKEISAFPTQN